MEPDASALLLDALQSCDYRGLYDRFASFLLPFGDFVPLHSHNLNPPATKKGATTTTSYSVSATAAPKKRGLPKKKKKLEPDPAALRPLAKQFLPFLCRALKHLPALLRKSPKSTNADVDDGRTVELLAVYRLLLDCLACIGPCLAGKPYSVHLQRGRLVVCLEACGRYAEAEEEALALLESLGAILVEAASMPKSRKIKIAGGGCFLPDPAQVNADDPEITMLVIEVITVLSGCAYKSKIRKEVAYDRILTLIDQVQPWLRFLNPEALQKYQILLVNTLYKCSLFLVEEYTDFEKELVQRFCLRMLRECINSRSVYHFASMVRKITSSINLQWPGGSFLLLGILNLTLESVVCSCKVDLLEAVNEFLETVSYIASRICAANIDTYRSAAKLLYEQGDDVLQVSSLVASILTLYASGLHFKFSSIQPKESVNDFHSSNNANTIMLFHDCGVDLQNLSIILDSLASSFHMSTYVNETVFNSEIKDSRVLPMAASESGKFDCCMQTHGKASLISYVDALEFLCKPVVESVNTAWKNLTPEQESILHSDTLNYVQKVLHQFSDLMLAASRHSDITERVEQRLNESHGTLLQVAVAAFRISLLTGGKYQKSLLHIHCIISSTWIEPQELKFLISAISNAGAVCYNNGWLEKASKALQLCIEIIWTYVKLMCRMYSSKSKGVYSDNTAEAQYKDAINDALSRIATVVDFLYKCGAKNIKEIIIKSLYELSAAEDIFHYMTGLLTLMKQWVKITCKEFKDVDAVDNAPVLYSSLLDYHPTWSMKIISIILEQELVAYDLMESRNPKLCQKMELKVMDFLLKDVYTSKDYNLQRSRVLITKGRAFRTHGTEGLNNCLECLSEAISVLRFIADDSSQDTASVSHQLALTYILYAHCAQEANQDCGVILHNVHCALNLWSEMNVQGYCSRSNYHQWGTMSILPLLCSMVDLLSLKGCLKFQLEICKVIIRFSMLENTLSEQCISMLWSNRRLNHSLCSSPIDEVFVSNISEQFGLNVKFLDYWINCIKQHPPSQCMLLQKLFPNDFVFSEATGLSSKRPFGAQISTEEIKEVAASLVAEVPFTCQSAFIAAYLYHDLSERLFSNGRISEALLYAKEALCLRNKILRRKFIYTVVEQSAKLKSDGVTQYRNDHISLEPVSNVITDVWPDFNKSGNLDDSLLSPWSVLRCYLESTFQVGIIHESTGNGAEAECLFRIGKNISCLQGFPVLAISFTTLLGQLYRRKHQWDLAENELKSAKKLLVEYDNIISCTRCKMVLEVRIDMQVGDLYRSIIGKGIQIKSTGSLSDALGLYRSSLEKLELAEMVSCIDICQKPEANGGISQSADSIKEASNRIQHAVKLCSSTKEENSSVCSICRSLNSHKNVFHTRQVPKESDDLSVLKTVNRKSQVKNISKKSLRCSTKNLNQQSKARRNGSSNQEHNGAAEADCGDKEECDCSKMECWRCLIHQVMETGFMQDIIHLNWECHRRRLVLMLLLKIAKCLGTHNGKHGEHEVHEVFGQCVSVLCNWKSLKQCGMPDSSLIECVVDESLGDFFRIERAAVLYNMSWYSLKGIISENPRFPCCSLSKIQMSTVLRWLLRAFILCQESPLLFQKVSRLLSSIFLLTTLDSSISLPLQTENSISLNHWAAYFHQVSVGTYLHCQYYSRNKACSSKTPEVFPNASMTENTVAASKFFRFVPEKLEDLEEHVTGFFKCLPTIPIICISMLGSDYANLIGEMLLLPSFFPAWILLSRLLANSQPVVMLLPVNLLQEEVQLEDGISDQKFSDVDTGSIKHWHCPWGYTVIDCVLPSYKQLLEENFLLLSNTTFAAADIQMKNASWWSQRTMLNNRLNKLLKSMEISWLGPWACLLLGEHSVPDRIEKLVHKLVSALKSEGRFEINYSLISAIIGGAKSVADAESCINQLLLYKGYFGRGACCGEERFRAFSAVAQTGLATEFIHDLVKEALAEYAEQVAREPVIIVLDSDVQMLPWENLPILRSQEVYRMPSVSSIFLTLDKSCSHHKRDSGFGTIIPAVDPLNAYYLLNPSGDLNDTQLEFEQWFRNQELEGKAGNLPDTKELIMALQNHDLFLYFGHGSGTQYIPEKEVQKLHQCAATLLMGCSSGSLLHRGCYAPQGAPLSYLFAGSPSIIANLWDVTDKDIDRFGKALLKSWLHEELDALNNSTRDGSLVQQFSCMGIDDEVALTSVKTRRKVYNGKLRNLSDGSNWGCRRNRIASFMSQARDSCKLPMLIGASPVCYGVPTVIWKKSQS
ncbi:hypothetical protein OPV22_026194 [Ensete ventricosum]|uniref:separase n=1 Tax=Ensete ventricosum TaxID=4639 RepID=A0AAV8PAG5_ENSVE|nr:hypothetical protein OPV22_026194 [Ensete ventricosum]